MCTVIKQVAYSKILFSGEKELTDYLNSKGDILYSDLIKDEIAKVDQLLVKDSKKEGQVGGNESQEKLAI